MLLKSLIYTGIVFIISFSLPPLTHAQSFDIATTYEVADTDAKTGDIISNNNNGLTRSEVSYDNKLFGVIVDQPIIVFREASESGKAVTRNGDAIVNVSDYNGEIKPGDYITTSPVKGVGMKGTQSGYVVGLATSSVTKGETVDFQARKLQTGQVNVALKIEYAEISTPRNSNRLLEYLGAAFFRNVQDPEKFTQVVKSIIAGIIAITSFAVGFFAFSKAIAKGVEAIGRNPLAKRAIQFSVMIQLLLTIFTTVAGIVASFIVLRL